MKRIIFHVDVNNAFLSWSAVDMLKNGSKLDIRNIISIVTADETKKRGVVLAKSYPAKKLGIITGESVYSAKRKSKNIYIVNANRKSYIKYSNLMYEILCKYSPDVERYSIDECFLDMSGMEKISGSIIDLAYKIKEEIKNTLGFTVNVGIGNNKVCAKMASDFEKPDKIHTLFDYEVKEKLFPLKVEDLFMVGKKTSVKLHELGINTIKDLALFDKNILYKHFKNFGTLIHDYANGIDYSSVLSEDKESKSISSSTTLISNTDNINELKHELYKLSGSIGLRLRKEKKYAKTITVQIKDSSFYSYQHGRKLVNPISSDKDIYKYSCEIFDEMFKESKIRLIGIRLNDLMENSYKQISLFEENEKHNENAIQSAIDKINEKYGSNTIVRASLVNKKNNS